MPLFDRYVAVDWSGANSPRTGRDSIWIAGAGRDGRAVDSINPPTRAAAMTEIGRRIAAARAKGERLLVGFDFVFGYPRGAARAIAGTADWRALWRYLADAVEDGDDNRSNRFEVAAEINRRIGAHFWGHPHGRSYGALAPTRAGISYQLIPERRMAEARQRSVQPVWKLTGAGSVGSQSLLGIARLARLIAEAPEIAVWPFDTDFERRLEAPVVLVEIYPSMFPLAGAVLPRDREQVEVVASTFAALDANEALAGFLAAPADLSDAERNLAVAEEGWIAGAGNPLPQAKTVDYVREPAEIYARSFATVRREARLGHLPPSLHAAAVRMIHACGMVDLAADIVGDDTIGQAVNAALASGATVLCDCEMVAAGIIRRALPAETRILVPLTDIGVEAARAAGTTRSALAVDAWRDQLAGAVVVIGNAPTALFRLLELLAEGAPRPAAIIAAPVGFVGAAESKALLAEGAHGVPFVTVRGRRGGSAIASAAFNALAGARA